MEWVVVVGWTMEEVVDVSRQSAAKVTEDVSHVRCWLVGTMGDIVGILSIHFAVCSCL